MYPTEIPILAVLEVYEGVLNMCTFAADEREMTKYIIGTISGKDVPRTPQTQGHLAEWLISASHWEMLQKMSDQILNATVEIFMHLGSADPGSSF